MQNVRIAAIIPAAGTSSRFSDGNKLMQSLRGRTVVEQTVARALESDVEEIVVVSGFDRDGIESCLEDFPVRIVYNEEFETGMGRSIAAGVEAASEADAYLIWPADMPFVSRDTVASIRRAADPERIVIPALKGRRGHPVLFGSFFRAELIALSKDEGARSILQKHPHMIIEVPVEDPAIHLDIDTAGALSAARSRESDSAFT